jgi:class 3 adenylate cyclase
VSAIAERIFGPDWGVRGIGGAGPADSVENRENIARFIVPLIAGLAAVAVVGWVMIPILDERVPGAHIALMLAILGFGLVVVTPLYWRYHRTLPLWFFHPLTVSVIGLLTLLAAAAGPRLAPLVGVGYVPTGTVAFILFRRRLAIGYAALTGIGYGATLAAKKGATAPVTLWIDVIGAVVIVGLTVAWLVERSRLLAQREHEATERAERAYAEAVEARDVVDLLIQNLEATVAEQVEELDRMGQLRRFLSPQVADTVLAANNEAILAPHRQQIAVFYCDLRGFTRFATGAEPEDIVDILGEYYRTVGVLIHNFEATVGTFVGDGIMAYFNDPIPCDDPAYRAVEMALALRAPMSELIDAWKGDGYELGYGIGITYGYATLGTIGFESRNDYTAVGSVVNLAARLCAEASTGEILIDARTQHAVRGRVDSQACHLILKGIPDPVTAYLIGDTIPNRG